MKILPGFSRARPVYPKDPAYPGRGPYLQIHVKQGRASMRNFRAYEERDFYRSDLLSWPPVAAGFCVIPGIFRKNNRMEWASVLTPFMRLSSTFYLNTQVGESLITNPDPKLWFPKRFYCMTETLTQAGGYLSAEASQT